MQCSWGVAAYSLSYSWSWCGFFIGNGSSTHLWLPRKKLKGNTLEYIGICDIVFVELAQLQHNEAMRLRGWLIWGYLHPHHINSIEIVAFFIYTATLWGLTFNSLEVLWVKTNAFAVFRRCVYHVNNLNLACHQFYNFLKQIQNNSNIQTDLKLWLATYVIKCARFEPVSLALFFIWDTTISNRAQYFECLPGEDVWKCALLSPCFKQYCNASISITTDFSLHLCCGCSDEV